MEIENTYKYIIIQVSKNILTVQCKNTAPIECKSGP